MATIEKTEYNAKSKELTIIFGYSPDIAYIHKNVPAKIANGFDTAESKGKFYHANVKGKYDFEKDFVK